MKMEGRQPAQRKEFGEGEGYDGYNQSKIKPC
jgi:hypothetical protein